MAKRRTSKPQKIVSVEQLLGRVLKTGPMPPWVEKALPLLTKRKKAKKR